MTAPADKLAAPPLTAEERALLEGRAEAITAELLAERRRQVAEEGYNPKHDERHAFTELALAGATYAAVACAHGALSSAERFMLDHTSAVLWPWFRDELKPKDPRRDLVRAGALIVAAIERLDREAILAADPEAA